MSDQFEASIEEAYARGVEAGRLDAVPPGTEPTPWCDPHDMPMISHKTVCWRGWVAFKNPADCHREDPVRHWVTEEEL